MKTYLTAEDQLFVIKSMEVILNKGLDLISLKEIVDMKGISRYQFIIGEETKQGGYETSVLIAPRKGMLFDKTVEEARVLLDSGNYSKLRVIGWYLREHPEFIKFKELYPAIKQKCDFGNEVEKEVKEEKKSYDPYDGWELTLHDNKYHVNHKRTAKYWSGR